MAFTAVSFPLALYSTEARGYALAALASTTALVSLVSWFEHQRIARLMVFAAVGSLGVLAHLSFAVVLAAAGLYALVLAASGRVTWFAALAPFAAPSATLALLALVDLRYLELGGGPPLQPLPFVSEATAMAIGGALGQGIAPLLGIAAVLMIGCSLLRLFGDARERFAAAPVRAMLPVFYVAVVAIPVLLVLVFKPPFFFSRYFLVSIVFVPVLLASGLQDTAARARKGLTATLVVLNVASLVSFWSAGRGHYQQALLEMARTSSSDPITVGSKHDLRTPVILDFHRDRLGGTVSRLTYVYQGGEFWIGDSAADVCEGCTLWRVYPSSPISGATWAVFRRTGG
jgi:hypothetical protein